MFFLLLNLFFRSEPYLEKVQLKDAFKQIISELKGDIYKFKGDSQNSLKFYNEAISSLETGMEFVIDNQKLLLEFYSSLADAYHATKQHKLSDEYYEKVLDIDSNNLVLPAM